MHIRILNCTCLDGQTDWSRECVEEICLEVWVLLVGGASWAGVWGLLWPSPGAPLP